MKSENAIIHFMNTKILTVNEYDPEPEVIREAAQVLKDGGLVAFPTETVYGLGGDGLNPEASGKIYAAKGRPSDNPLILHIAEREELIPLTAEIPQMAERLMDTFWPGPMTLIFRKSEQVPYETTGGLDTVAGSDAESSGSAKTDTGGRTSDRSAQRQSFRTPKSDECIPCGGGSERQD